MLLRYECKNIAGQLLVKEKNASQIWKVDLSQGTTVRHTIFVQEAGEPVLLQEFKAPEVRDYVLDNIRRDLKLNNGSELVIPYLYCYKSVADDAAFKMLKHMGYSKHFLTIAIEVAKAKCKEWSSTGRERVVFDLAKLQHEDPDIEAYKHGWGLKIPHAVQMKGINPYQFYKFILK